MRRRACASTSQRAVKRFAGCCEAPALSKREDGFSRSGVFPFCAMRKTSGKSGGKTPRKRRTLNSYYIARDFSSDVAGNAPPLARGPRADFSVLRRCVKRSIIEFQRKRENASENRLGKGGRELTSPRAPKVRNLRSGPFRRHSPP